MIVRSKLNHHRDHPVTWIRWGTSTARTRGSPTCPWRRSSENLAAPISKADSDKTETFRFDIGTTF